MSTKIRIVADEPIGTISPMIHGHFMEHLGGCIDGGIWVGPESTIPNTGGIRNDVVQALSKLEPPVARWPGGCFADDYHWRDGIGPMESRPRRINMHWGNCIERNEFGTHEFIAFCRALGAAPYLAGNVGSGTPSELRDWVEYCNFPGGSTASDERIANGSQEPFQVKYWGVGNENWGCGGTFTPEDYATEYRRYSTYLRNWGGTNLYLIACGPNRNDKGWTKRFFEKLKRDFWGGAPIHGFAGHLYCHSDSTATEFEETHWYQMLRSASEIEPMVVEQRALLDEYDPDRKIGLIIDEWGTWHRPTPGTNPAFLWQQSTIRDAVVAGYTLDVFHRHADKVAMANIAQTINVLQSLILTEGDRMVLTPTYHVFDLYRPHKGGKSLRFVTDLEKVEGVVQVLGSASVKGNVVTLTLTNSHMTQGVEVSVSFQGMKISEVTEAVGIRAEGDVRSHNTFDDPNRVGIGPLDTPHLDSHGNLIVHLLPAAVARFTLATV